MSDRLTFRILTPSREVLSREVDAANLVAAEGEVGILPGHAALLAELRPGEASFQDGSVVEHFALGEGFLEVSDDVVVALVRSAETPEEIDPERALRRQSQREAELRKLDLSESAMKRAEVSLQKQLARLQVSGRQRGH